MNEQERKSQEFWTDVKQYWHMYLALAATALLTVFAGVYLGLAPERDGTLIFADNWDAFRRVFFAAYFGVTFFVVSEGAVLYSKARLIARDVNEIGEDIAAQRVSMQVMLVVSIVNVAVTSLVAGEILASWLGALDNWVVIPDFAQTWIVTAPPVLLVFYVVLSLVYQQNSQRARLKREVEQSKRQAQADAERAFAMQYMHSYREHAPAAARAAARTNALRDAERWAGAGVSTEPEIANAQPAGVSSAALIANALDVELAQANPTQGERTQGTLPRDLTS